MRELNGLLAERNARPGGTCTCGPDELEEDIEEFRKKLALRLKEIVRRCIAEKAAAASQSTEVDGPAPA